jgi:hypothetical protein
VHPVRSEGAFHRAHHICHQSDGSIRLPPPVVLITPRLYRDPCVDFSLSDDSLMRRRIENLDGGEQTSEDDGGCHGSYAQRERAVSQTGTDYFIRHLAARFLGLLLSEVGSIQRPRPLEQRGLAAANVRLAPPRWCAPHAHDLMPDDGKTALGTQALDQMRRRPQTTAWLCRSDRLTRGAPRHRCMSMHPHQSRAHGAARTSEAALMPRGARRRVRARRTNAGPENRARELAR